MEPLQCECGELIPTELTFTGIFNWWDEHQRSDSLPHFVINDLLEAEMSRGEL